MSITAKGRYVLSRDGKIISEHSSHFEVFDALSQGALPPGEYRIDQPYLVMTVKPTVVPAPAVARPGLNLAGVGYYQSIYPYINIARNCSAWSSANWPARSVVVDKFGWPTLAPGDSLRLNVAMHMGEMAYVPPGAYKIVTASGAEVGVYKDSGLAIINRTRGTGTATFNVVADGDPTLIVEVRNPGTTPITVDDLSVHRVEHEPLLKAGKVFQPEFLEQLKNLAVIRTLDWTEANNSGVIASPADIPTERNMSWVKPSPSVFGRLLNELREIGADPVLWVTTPVGARSVRYSSDAGLITATNEFAEGEPIMFFSWATPPAGLSKHVRYYARDVTPTSFRVAAEPGGPALDVAASALDWGRRVGSLKHSIPAVMDAYFEAIYKVCPTAELMVEATNEPWNTAFTQSHWLAGPGAFLGGSGSNIGHGYAWLSLQAWASAKKFFPGARRVVNGQAANFAAMRSMFDYVAPDGLFKFGSLIDYYAAAPYVYLIGDDGKEVPMAAAVTAPDEQVLGWLNKGVALAAKRMASTKAALAAVNPAIKLTSYEGGHHVFFQGSLAGAGAWGKRFQSLLDSAAGLAWAKDYREQVFVANAVEHMVWFTSAGYWVATDSSVQTWGIRPGLRTTYISRWFGGL